MRDGAHPAPPAAPPLKHGPDMLIVLPVAGERREGGPPAHRLQQLVEILFQAIVLVRERQFCALAMERAGDSPGDAALVGDAHDQRPFALQQHGAPPLSNLTICTTYTITCTLP